MIPVSKPTVRSAQPAQAPVRLSLSAGVGGRPCLPSFGGLHPPGAHHLNRIRSVHMEAAPGNRGGLLRFRATTRRSCPCVRSREDAAVRLFHDNRDIDHTLGTHAGRVTMGGVSGGPDAATLHVGITGSIPDPPPLALNRESLHAMQVRVLLPRGNPWDGGMVDAPEFRSGRKAHSGSPTRARG